MAWRKRQLLRVSVAGDLGQRDWRIGVLGDIAAESQDQQKSVSEMKQSSWRVERRVEESEESGWAVDGQWLGRRLVLDVR